MNITSSYGCGFMGEPRMRYPLRSKIFEIDERLTERCYEDISFDECEKLRERLRAFSEDGFAQWGRNVLRIVDAHAKRCVDCKVYIGPSVDYFCEECGARESARAYKRSIKEQRRVIKEAKRELRRQVQLLKEKEAYGRYR